jgi:hypothetical protein
MANAIVICCRDFFRLARAGDLLCQAGTFCIRKSPRATLWTAGITSSGYLSNFIGLNGFSGLQAILAPFIVGGGMLTLGLCLKYLPSSLWRQLASIAEANDLNLMEDYRKSQVLCHLNQLWDKVYFYEAKWQYTSQQRQAEKAQILAFKEQLDDTLSHWKPDLLVHLGAHTDEDRADLVQALMTERPLSCDLEKSREGFLISGLYALQHALPQSTQADQIGFRLDLYEDYCDGACFDQSDDKLIQQFKGHTCLGAVRKLAHLNVFRLLCHAPRLVTRKLWFALITRKVATGVGKAVRTLNKRYHTDRFNAQVLLWPGEEDASWLRKYEHARDDILTLRKQILHGALGANYDDTRFLLNRMLLPGFKQATALRMAYDYQYCDQSLNYVTEDTQETITNDVLTDLTRFGCSRLRLRRLEKHLHEITHALQSFADFLKSGDYASVLEDPESLRAATLMFHTHRRTIQKLWKKNTPQATDKVRNMILDAVSDKETYTRQLVALRMHHQLTQLQIQEYRTLVKTLAY